MFKGYGTHGSVMHHEMIIMEYPQADGRKRPMCRCGCRKKSTHMQYCNGVAMNHGCEKSLNEFKEKVEKAKKNVEERSKSESGVFGRIAHLPRKVHPR